MLAVGTWSVLLAEGNLQLLMLACCEMWKRWPETHGDFVQMQTKYLSDTAAIAILESLACFSRMLSPIGTNTSVMSLAHPQH